MIRGRSALLRGPRRSGRRPIASMGKAYAGMSRAERVASTRAAKIVLESDPVITVGDPNNLLRFRLPGPSYLRGLNRGGWR
jgi:hypothetical protein